MGSSSEGMFVRDMPCQGLKAATGFAREWVGGRYILALRAICCGDWAAPIQVNWDLKTM